MADFIIELDSTILEVLLELVAAAGCADHDMSEPLSFQKLKILSSSVIYLKLNWAPSGIKLYLPLM